MIEIVKTDATNKDFIELVKELDAYLTITDGDEHDFYDQYNKLDEIKYVLVAYHNRRAVGCGALKQFSANKMEIKRMYTVAQQRGQGIASLILANLEKQAKELGFDNCILETGLRQHEAIHLYKKNNYQIIPNYGQYIGVENSLCFWKKI